MSIKHITKTHTGRGLLAFGLAALLIAAGVSIAWASTNTPRSASHSARQDDPTPVQLEFPTPTETPGPPTATATRTPTPMGQAMVEAISNETNVRSGPDINASKLGMIYPGTVYPVIGKRFDWYQIEYPNSPNGTAWVYRQVVTLTGDEAAIPELTLEDIPTVDPAFLSIQQTVEFITATPGAIASLTAQAMVTPTGVFTAAPGEAATLEPGAPLPTFTSPPFTPTPVVIPKAVPTTTSTEGGLPPIVPILALGALGVMGLLVSLLRRL